MQGIPPRREKKHIARKKQACSRVHVTKSKQERAKKKQAHRQLQKITTKNQACVNIASEKRIEKKNKKKAREITEKP